MNPPLVRIINTTAGLISEYKEIRGSRFITDRKCDRCHQPLEHQIVIKLHQIHLSTGAYIARTDKPHIIEHYTFSCTCKAFQAPKKPKKQSKSHNQKKSTKQAGRTKRRH